MHRILPTPALRISYNQCPRGVHMCPIEWSKVRLPGDSVGRLLAAEGCRVVSRTFAQCQGVPSALRVRTSLEDSLCGMFGMQHLITRGQQMQSWPCQRVFRCSHGASSQDMSGITHILSSYSHSKKIFLAWAVDSPHDEDRVSGSPRP